MTSRTERTPARSRLSGHLAPHRVEVARWALSHGHSFNLDAGTVVLAVVDEDAEPHGCPADDRPQTWTRQRVAEILWTGAADWCEANEVELPAGTSEALWTYLAFLDDTGRLKGDSLTALRAELTASAGLDRRGRLRHPSGGRSTTAEVRPLPRLA